MELLCVLAALAVLFLFCAFLTLRCGLHSALAPLTAPIFWSTVTPGKFPTCWFEPVRQLKSVVLPQFWFPARAKITSEHPLSGRLRFVRRRPS